MTNEKESKGLIIVHPKRREKHATLMYNLISASGKIPVVLWDEDVWTNNKTTIDSTQLIVFFGSAGRKYNEGINWEFDKFSIKYGKLGKRAIIDVEWLNPIEIVNFVKYYNSRIDELNASVKKLWGNLQVAAIGAGGVAIAAGAAKVAGVGAVKAAGIGAIATKVAGGLLLGKILVPAAVAALPIYAALKIKDISDAMYTLSIYEFVLGGGLDSLLGINNG